MTTHRTITYSPAYTIVPTYECFNRCQYCNFRQDPGQSPWLSLAAAQSRLAPLQTVTPPVIEILVLSGEVHPQSPRRAAWFERIYQLCELALEMGFLPHTNVGPLSYEEMSQLGQVNVSLGLMLEQITLKLQTTVHQQAPSKDPQRRLQQITWAGKLQIPFTTGILLGLGESPDDRAASLRAIAQQHQQYGHIQDVILQPYSPGSHEAWSNVGFDLSQLPDVVHMARKILPADVVIQIPPNLIHQPQVLLQCLDAGARDLGGISPHDEVNPDYLHPTAQQLQKLLEPHNWQLKVRLPVYPQHRPWLNTRLKTAIAPHDSGNVKECVGVL